MIFWFEFVEYGVFMNSRKIIPVLFLMMAVCLGSSASASMTVAVTPDSATVGDVITMSVILNVPKDARVIPPVTGKGFGDFVVMSALDEIVAGGDGDTVRYQYNIATFKPQNCTIPSLRFLVMNAGVDTVDVNGQARDVQAQDGRPKDALADTIFTPEIPIRIISVIPTDIPDDSGLAIRDLKGQQKTGGMDVRSLWVLLAIVAAVLIYYFLEKRAKKKAGEEPPTVIVIPPYEEAIKAIEELEAKKYLMTGQIREYAFELSEIFKRYIGRRYDTIASELTTEEIVAWLEYSGISREMRLCAERFFCTSDQVKFAKWKPDQKTINSFMDDVTMFLEATKPNSELQYELKTKRMGVVE
jgi:hypothetical protein